MLVEGSDYLTTLKEGNRVLGEELVNEWVTVQSHDGFHVGSIYNRSLSTCR